MLATCGGAFWQNGYPNISFMSRVNYHHLGINRTNRLLMCLCSAAIWTVNSEIKRYVATLDRLVFGVTILTNSRYSEANRKVSCQMHYKLGEQIVKLPIHKITHSLIP